MTSLTPTMTTMTTMTMTTATTAATAATAATTATATMTCTNPPRAAQARRWVPFASALARVQRDRVTPAQTRPLHRV